MGFNPKKYITIFEVRIDTKSDLKIHDNTEARSRPLNPPPPPFALISPLNYNFTYSAARTCPDACRSNIYPHIPIE